MVKLSGKIISAIIGVSAVGTITVAAAVTANQPKVAQTESSSPSTAVSLASEASSTVEPASSAVLSSAVSSKGKVDTVADGVNEIQKATDDGVSKIHEETNKAVSQIQADQKAADELKAKKAERLKQEQENERYAIIDPDSGALVWPGDSGYDSLKAQLGGDAGKVDPDKSTACQAALKQAQAKIEAQQKAESAASSLGGKSDQIISVN